MMWNSENRKSQLYKLMCKMSLSDIFSRCWLWGDKMIETYKKHDACFTWHIECIWYFVRQAIFFLLFRWIIVTNSQLQRLDWFGPSFLFTGHIRYKVHTVVHRVVYRGRSPPRVQISAQLLITCVTWSQLFKLSVTLFSSGEKMRLIIIDTSQGYCNDYMK